MTHDELLAKIDTPNELHVPNADGTTKIYKLKSQHMKALHAVVEIIKDYRGDEGVIANAEFDQGVRALCHLIIQAIEEHIK